ncbi:MAG: hypothetical protein HGA76_11005, partial [Candidatus Firestonebacteria bacterium]|nr:hypothetical protein [Candidatus Firestonebacteria bacterium]
EHRFRTSQSAEKSVVRNRGKFNQSRIKITPVAAVFPPNWKNLKNVVAVFRKAYKNKAFDLDKPSVNCFIGNIGPETPAGIYKILPLSEKWQKK